MAFSVGDVINSPILGGAGELQYPEKTTRLHGLAIFKTVDGDGNLLNTTIKLPLPAGLAFTDAAAYENADLGLVGNFIPAGGEQTEQEQQATADKLTVANGMRITTDLLSKVTGNRTRAAMGKTPNPNTRALFKQVNLRTFQISFKMIPSSSTEAEKIKKIVKAFRQELYPTSTGESVGDDFEIAYLFPNRFRIRFYLGPDEERYEVEPKLLDAYLTNMTTQYNSGGQAVMAEAGGNLSFSETDISLTFLESKTLFSRDVRNEGY
jgi:hypothetical protein